MHAGVPAIVTHEWPMNELINDGHPATHRNTPQHTATHCNTPQHTATHTATRMHAGVPAIVTDGWPMNELIDDGHNGLLVPATQTGWFHMAPTWEVAPQCMYTCMYMCMCVCVFTYVCMFADFT